MRPDRCPLSWCCRSSRAASLASCHPALAHGPVRFRRLSCPRAPFASGDTWNMYALVQTLPPVSQAITVTVTPTPADIVVRRCTVQVVRHGGWSWGPQPRRLVDQVLAALPGLIAERLADLAPDDASQDVEITEPVRVAVSLPLADLLSGRFDGLPHAAVAMEPLPIPLLRVQPCQSPWSRPHQTLLADHVPPRDARSSAHDAGRVPRQALRARRTRPVPGASAGRHAGGLAPVARLSPRPARLAPVPEQGRSRPGQVPAFRTAPAIQPAPVPARQRRYPRPRKPAGPGNSGTPSAPSPRGSATGVHPAQHAADDPAPAFSDRPALAAASAPGPQPPRTAATAAAAQPQSATATPAAASRRAQPPRQPAVPPPARPPPHRRAAAVGQRPRRQSRRRPRRSRDLGRCGPGRTPPRRRWRPRLRRSPARCRSCCWARLTRPATSPRSGRPCSRPACRRRRRCSPPRSPTRCWGRWSAAGAAGPRTWPRRPPSPDSAPRYPARP